MNEVKPVIIVYEDRCRLFLPQRYFHAQIVHRSRKKFWSFLRGGNKEKARASPPKERSLKLSWYLINHVPAGKQVGITGWMDRVVAGR